MCGICGVVNADGRPVDAGTLARMRDVMTYRGPDDAGMYIDEGVGLGHRRLSIIDLATGQQPMTNEDRSLWVVFNGEIYNYVELRESYLRSGHRLATSSDTEVILHLYEEFGEDCVRYFNGMFAFAIWDRRERQLFLGRDRVGVKPLYYAVRNGTLLFASEIKSLLQHEALDVRVSPTAIDEFMTFGYVQTPRTLFTGIYRLPEGHTLTWRNGEVRLRQYWDVEFKPDTRRSEREHCEGLLALLQDSLRLRLRSDVPLGVFLSGGIDSSAVTGLLARSVGKVKTFSIGFDAGRGYNELDYARAVARRFETDHHEIVLSPRDFQDFVPRFVYHMDEPVTEGAAIPLYFVSKLTAQHVKVVLSGEGSDELFAGYPIYAYMRAIEQYRRVPAALRGVAAPALRLLAGSPKIDKYLYLAELPLERRYLNVHLFDPRVHARLYSGAFKATLESFDAPATLDAIYEHTRSWDLLSRLLYLDTKTWLPNDILIKADRMSMATSIELRVPFLDYRLIEYAATIPSEYKLRGRTTKYILKRALGDLLPDEILHRSKMGFPTPLAWMFKGDMCGYVREILLEKRTAERGYFDPGAVRRLVEDHLSGRSDHHQALWRLLLIEEWHRLFVDGRGKAGMVEPRPVAV